MQSPDRSEGWIVALNVVFETDAGSQVVLPANALAPATWRPLWETIARPHKGLVIWRSESEGVTIATLGEEPSEPNGPWQRLGVFGRDVRAKDLRATPDESLVARWELMNHVAGEPEGDLDQRLPPTLRWEYRVIDIGVLFARERLQQNLDQLGDAGWELVTVFDKTSNWLAGMEKGFLLFKRPVRTVGDLVADIRYAERATQALQDRAEEENSMRGQELCRNSEA